MMDIALSNFETLNGLFKRPQVPNNQLPVQTRSAELLGGPFLSRVQTQTRYGILMDRIETRIGYFSTSLLIQRLELPHR